MEDSSEINWTKWATEKFPVTINGKISTNAGYILKLFAESEGVDTAKFNKKKIISGRDKPSHQRIEKPKNYKQHFHALIHSCKSTKIGIERKAEGWWNRYSWWNHFYKCDYPLWLHSSKPCPTKKENGHSKGAGKIGCRKCIVKSRRDCETM